jgi:hypothetical protein
MPRSRTIGLRKSPPDCRFAGSVDAHRLLAGPEGRRQSRRGAALRKRKHRRRSAGGRACNEILPTIKKGFTLHICSTFGKASFMPEFQRSASGL